MSCERCSARRRAVAAVLGLVAALAAAPARADDVSGPGLGVGTRRSGIDSLTSADPVLAPLDAPAPPAAPSARPSLLPGNAGVYLGLSVGRPDYGLSCVAGALGCGEPSRGWRLYTGGMVNPHLGVELGLLDLGRAERGAGNVRARGVDLAVVGRLPLGHALGAFGKLGTTWGRTRADAEPGRGLVAGDASGFGLTVGAGLALDVAAHWSALLEWEQRDLRFAGDASEPVDTTSLGLRYRF
ncbi:MAG: porin family protein [Betaproteobacteria bacterium]